MANRKVSVGLTLEAGQYKAEADVTTAKTDKLDRSIKDVDRDITKIPPDAAKAAAAMKLLGGDADGVRGKLHDVGPEAVTSLQLIDKQIDETRVKLRQAAEDFNRTGSADSFSLWQKLTADHGELQKFKRDLSAALGVVERDSSESGDRSGKSFTNGFTGTFAKGSTKMVEGLARLPWAGAIFRPLSNAFESMPPEAQAAIGLGIAAAITASAALIGGALDGALLAGVGLGGIALGIVGQIHDPAVVGAAKRFASEFQSDLTHATDGFGPVFVRALQRLEAEADHLQPSLTRAFNSVLPSAQHLLDNVSVLADRAAPGFEKAMEAAGPVLDQIASDLPGLGHAISQFFDLIARGSAGGADALHDIIKVFEVLLIATGAEFDMLSKVFTAMEIAADLARGKFADAAAKMLELKGGMHDGTDEAKNLTDQLGGGGLAGAAGSASGAVSALDDAVLAFNNDAMDAQSASLSFKDSVDSLTDALKNSKQGLDDNSAAGRKAEEAYLAGVSAAQQHAAAVLQSSGSAIEAAKAYQQDKTALDNAARAAGASKSQIDALNKSLDNTVKVRRGSVTITVSVKGNGQSLLTRSDSDITKILGTNLQFRASGGPIVPGQPYVVGEQGPELIVPDRPGVVVPHDTRFVSARQVSPPVGGTVGASMPGPSVTQNIYATQMDEARLAALVDRRLAAAGIR